MCTSADAGVEEDWFARGETRAGRLEHAASMNSRGNRRQGETVKYVGMARVDDAQDAVISTSELRHNLE